MSDFIHDQNEFDSYHSQSVGQPGPMAEFSGVPGGSAGFVPPEPPRKKGRRGMKVVALLLACVIVGGGAGVGGAALYGNLSGGQGGTTIYEADTPLSAVTLSNVPSSDPMTPAEIYAANVNATVDITVDVVTTNWWGMTTSGAAAGSGFVITQDGYIVTNYHVIDVQGAQTITVAMYDGTTYPATVVGYDEDHDLAVLKIEATGLQTVVLGDSDSLVVGDSVAAIGNPLGELTFSLTTGVISALDRSVTLSSGVVMDLMQTDCAINSGNSGGPLFNQYGEVVGITNAKYSSSSNSEASIDNIGFAIPINQVKDLITQLIETGEIVQPYLGVGVRTVSTEGQQYGVPAGAYVASVEEGGPAAQAGVQVGDVITALNGEAVETQQELTSLKNRYQPGDTVTLTLYRDGEELEVSVVLGTTPEETQPAVQPSASIQQDNGYNGYNGWPFGFGY